MAVMKCWSFPYSKSGAMKSYHRVEKQSNGKMPITVLWGILLPDHFQKTLMQALVCRRFFYCAKPVE
jgi:hypothetical protein